MPAEATPGQAARRAYYAALAASPLRKGREGAAWDAAAGDVAAPLREELEQWKTRHEQLAVRLDEAGVQLITAHGELDEAREEIASLRGQLDRAESDVSDYRDALTAMQRERDAALAGVASAEEHQAARWPRCPDGCGCRMDGQHADVRDCGCDGPCTMECSENGYPDAPSYREIAVRQAEGERDALRTDAFDAARLADRYRAALETLRDGDYNPDVKDTFTIAREALEGGGDD